MVTDFILIINQMEFHLIQNLKKNCHHDYIPFNLKGKENIFVRAHTRSLNALRDKIQIAAQCVSRGSPSSKTSIFASLHPIQARTQSSTCIWYACKTCVCVRSGEI